MFEGQSQNCKKNETINGTFASDVIILGGEARMTTFVIVTVFFVFRMTKEGLKVEKSYDVICDRFLTYDHNYIVILKFLIISPITFKLSPKL